MDTRDKEGGDDESGNADQERGHIEGQDDGPGDLHGNRADIVGLGIEAHETREVLEGDEAQAQGVAPKQALGQDERGKPQEDVAHLLVFGSQGLEHANHLRALQNDDEQARDHRDNRHGDHQSEDEPDVEVHQLQPGEDLRVHLRDRGGGIGLAIVVGGAVDALHDLVLHLVDLPEVAHQHLRPAILVLLPAVEAVGGIEVGEAHLLVILLEIGLVDARDGEAARAHPLVVDEIGEDALPTLHAQLVGNGLRDEQPLRGGGIGEMGNRPLHHILVDKGRVVFRTDALEGHAQEVVVGLEDALCHRVALHVAHAWYLAEDGRHGVVHLYRILVGGHQAGDIGHGNMASEAHDLVADRMFETKDHAHRDDHHGQTDGHTCRGDADGRLGHLLTSSSLAVDTACDKQGEIHSVSIEMNA